MVRKKKLENQLERFIYSARLILLAELDQKKTRYRKCRSRSSPGIMNFSGLKSRRQNSKFLVIPNQSVFYFIFLNSISCLTGDPLSVQLSATPWRIHRRWVDQIVGACLVVLMIDSRLIDSCRSAAWGPPSFVTSTVKQHAKTSVTRTWKSPRTLTIPTAAPPTPNSWPSSQRWLEEEPLSFCHLRRRADWISTLAKWLVTPGPYSTSNGTRLTTTSSLLRPKTAPSNSGTFPTAVLRAMSSSGWWSSAATSVAAPTSNGTRRPIMSSSALVPITSFSSGISGPGRPSTSSSVTRMSFIPCRSTATALYWPQLAKTSSCASWSRGRGEWSRRALVTSAAKPAKWSTWAIRVGSSRPDSLANQIDSTPCGRKRIWVLRSGAKWSIPPLESFSPFTIPTLAWSTWPAKATATSAITK